MTGMLGVYLAAAELTYKGFIVSPTSRSAIGADLLVTDQECRKAWSVQVKTNRKAASFWLVDAHTSKFKSKSHIYVFVNLRGDERPEYIVVASAFVAKARGSVQGEDRVRVVRISEEQISTRKTEGWELFGR